MMLAQNQVSVNSPPAALAPAGAGAVEELRGTPSTATFCLADELRGTLREVVAALRAQPHPPITTCTT